MLKTISGLILYFGLLSSLFFAPESSHEAFESAGYRADFNALEDNCPFIDYVYKNDHDGCLGGGDITIVIDCDPLDPNYLECLENVEYSIDGGQTWQAENSFMNLPVGVYYPAIRRPGGFGFDECFSSYGPTEIVQEKFPGPEANFTVEDVCDEGESGSITVHAIGGNPPYTYQLGDGEPQTENVFSGLAPWYLPTQNLQFRPLWKPTKCL